MSKSAPLLDTNIIIDVLNGNDNARNYLRSLPVLRVPAVAVFEVLTGCTGPRRKQKSVALEIFDACEVVGFTQADAEYAAGLFLKSPRKKKIIDYFIAGTADTHGFEVATRNPKDFKSIKAFAPYKLG